MDVPERVMGRRGEDRAAEEPAPGIVLGQRRVRPELVEAGEGEDVVRLGVKVVRDLLPVLGLLPFVLALRGNQGSALHGCFAERGLHQDGFAPGIDQPRADLEVFGPGRDQAPAGDQQPPVNSALVQPFGDDRNVLCRGHVPARRGRGALDFLGIKLREKIPGRL